MLLHRTRITAKGDRYILEDAALDVVLLLEPPSDLELEATAEASKQTVKDHAQTVLFPTCVGVAESATSRDTCKEP